MAMTDVPKVVIRRLPLYVRHLEHLIEQGERVISSAGMGRLIGVTPAQIRKDLSYFGEFGRQGLGYDLVYLRSQLLHILQADKQWHLALIGAGALGHALVHYREFREHLYHIVAAFDVDSAKVGSQIGDLTIQGMDDLADTVADLGVEIGILAVPSDAAQQAADDLVASGIKAILNYAPIGLSVPDGVRVAHIDPLASLQTLSYYL